jgi:hypothetical protein
MQFEVVKTPAKITRGLSGRADIAADYGMLFVFSRKSRCGFWMNEMLAPIDIIWLDDDGTIVGIEAEVSPDTFPEMFYSPVPVRLVLETRAGEANAKGWTVGTRVELPDRV